MTGAGSKVRAVPAPQPLVQQNSIERMLANLPAARPHLLPPSLARWHDPQETSDYFKEIQLTPVGALIWSHFPITVYVQPVEAEGSPFLVQRSQRWVQAVETAIQEWTPYLPLSQVEQAKEADITVWRNAPPLKFERTNTSQTSDRRFLPISRARSAETVFELYAKSRSGSPHSPILAHRIKIYIRPDQADSYLQAAARHEMGHALGIWGHSPQPTDALYFSQVRHPPNISARDLNTLKRVYQQPTRLGWEIEKPKENLLEKLQSSGNRLQEKS